MPPQPAGGARPHLAAGELEPGLGKASVQEHKDERALQVISYQTPTTQLSPFSCLHFFTSLHLNADDTE